MPRTTSAYEPRTHSCSCQDAEAIKVRATNTRALLYFNQEAKTRAAGSKGAAAHLVERQLEDIQATTSPETNTRKGNHTRAQAQGP
eukprot:1161347-Pelagomonas_calceolata.AAC.7